MNFYLQNTNNFRLVHRDCAGDHAIKLTNSMADARSFASWREASQFSQNFGPDYAVVDPATMD